MRIAIGMYRKAIINSLFSALTTKFVGDIMKKRGSIVEKKEIDFNTVGLIFYRVFFGVDRRGISK